MKRDCKEFRKVYNKYGMFFYFGASEENCESFLNIFFFLMRFDCRKKTNLNVNVNLLSYSQWHLWYCHGTLSASVSLSPSSDLISHVWLLEAWIIIWKNYTTDICRGWWGRTDPRSSPSPSYLIVTSTHYSENMPDHVW